MTKQELIAAIAAAIENNSTIEGEKDDALTFGDVKGLVYDKEGADVEFADGTAYRITAEKKK